MNLCQCGCGQTVKKAWVHGHNRRGVLYTPEQRAKCSQRAKELGLRPPDHTGRKFPGRGKGLKRSDEAKRNMREGIRRSEKRQAWYVRRADGRYKGKNAPNWQGGRSKLPYPWEWTAELKSAIRERDGGVCQSCSGPPKRQSLDVHHLDGDKRNCEPSNLVSLCHPCHQKLHLGSGIPLERHRLAIPMATKSFETRRQKYGRLRAEASALYGDGMSAKMVAEVMGRKPATVNYWLRSAGLTRSLAVAQTLRRARERLAVTANAA